MEINNVTVIGAGTMGAGIAQVSALVGCNTVLFDIADAPIEKGLAGIEKSLQKGVDRDKVTPEDRDAALSRITTSMDLAAAVASADLVVEAVPEDLELKRKIFRDVEAHAPAHAILATNTSSLPISDIAAGVESPARVVGMHFFNPVPVMKLLEIVVGKETADETRDAVVAFGERLSKEVITVKDTPGFASSRLGICIAMEAIRMLEQGVASPEDIDRAMVFGYGHPMGPLRLTDLVGLDVRMAIAEHLAEALDAPAFQPPEILRKLVAEGKLGRKSGHGFYGWED